MGKFTASRPVGSVRMATPTAVKDVAVSIATNPTGDGITGAMSLTLLATWNVPVVLLCVLVSLLMWKRLDGVSRWIALSALFTLGARAFFFSNQGGGWGSRFSFAVLGNLAILAAIGTESVAEAIGRKRAYALVATSLAVALLIQLPVRGVQAERIVRPYYDATRWMKHYDADVLVFPGETVRWGRMMLQNDPFLRNRPKLMNFADLGQVGVDSLRRSYPGRVRVVTRDELVAFGLKRVSRFGRFELE
jgi:hypothetical protein